MLVIARRGLGVLRFDRRPYGAAAFGQPNLALRSPRCDLASVQGLSSTPSLMGTQRRSEALLIDGNRPA
jgi:hypothetical protein